MSALSSSFFQLFEFSCFAICVLYDIFSIMVNYGFTVAKLLHLHYNDFLTCNQTHLAYCCALSVMCNRDLRLRGSSGHSLMLSPLGAPCMQGPVVPSQRLLSLWWWEPGRIIDFTGIIYLCPLVSNTDDGEPFPTLCRNFPGAGTEPCACLFARPVLGSLFLCRSFLGLRQERTSPTARAERGGLECLRPAAL